MMVNISPQDLSSSYLDFELDDLGSNDLSQTEAQRSLQRALQRLAQQALASPSISVLLRDITQVLGDSLMAQSYRCWQVLSDRHTLQQVTAIGPWENHSHSRSHSHSHSHSRSQIPGQRSGKRPGQGSRDRLGASPWPVAAAQTSHCSGRRSMVLPSQLKLQEHPWLAPLLALDQPLRFRSDSLSPSTVSWIGKLLPTDCCLEGGFCEGALLPIRGLAQEPLALVELYRPGPAFGLDDLTFLQSAADLLATAIQRARSEALLETQSLVLEQLAGGAVITDVLNSLCRLIEEHSPGGLCSIQLLDSSGRKMLATAAPNFPPEWKQAINGLEIGEGVASCGTALFRREPVFVNDIANDPLWEPFKAFAAEHGIYSCWSMPFFSQTGEILGSFALSHRTSCAPLPYHHQLLRTAAHLASIATEHSRSMAQLQHQANHDVLTGLSNRTVLLNRIRQQFERREPTPFAVLFLDVDHFKLINDSWGHGVGDQLLVAIARRLTHYLDHRALVARLGGDEFAVVLEHSRSPAQVLALAEQLIQVLGGMFAIGDREIFAAASVGIAYSSDRHQDPEAMLREADIAMYWAKQHPTGAKVAVFDQTMHEQVLNRLALETGLRQAVRGLEQNQHQVRALPGENHNHQLRLYYQPIVELKTRAIIGFEALLRWWHPERGEISPELFIPVAEETGLILPLGSWVLQEAIQQLQQWHGHLGQSSLIMSINVSGRQLFQVDFPDQVQQLLEQTQVPPACIKLEITETVLMGASTAITQRLEALRALGVHLSLDDFGTGYSSLSYLHRFPVNTLKIDRLFVMGLVPEQDQLTRTMVALSHGLGLVAIAEGIETEGQLAQLTAMDCEYGQGFLFSKPVNRVEAEALLWGSGVGD